MTRAITVQQPWADAIAFGGKNIENRSRNFPNRYRGDLLIHAGARSSARGMFDERVQQAFGRMVDRPSLARSEIVAVCDLVDVHPSAGCCKPWGDDEYRGRPVVHLVLEDVIPVSVPWGQGRLGLWTPPAELLEAVFPGRRVDG